MRKTLRNISVIFKLGLFIRFDWLSGSGHKWQKYWFWMMI